MTDLSNIVKPLVWYQVGSETKASTPWGFYMIANEAEGWALWCPNEDIEDEPGHGYHQSEDAAKEYANGHLKKCILSAINQDVLAACVREGLEMGARMVWARSWQPDPLLSKPNFMLWCAAKRIRDNASDPDAIAAAVERAAGKVGE